MDDDPFLDPDDDDLDDDDLDGMDWYPPIKIYVSNSIPRIRLQDKDRNVGKWKVISIKK